MDVVIRIAWGFLALLHLPPAAALVAPSVVQRLYAVAPDVDVGVLIVHRGALFLAVVALSIFALIDSGPRRAISLAVALSLIGFLLVYARAGLPPGPLRSIAMADGLGLAPLGLVLWDAWVR